jgi:predicted O-methyltransferase YrrM
MKKYNIHFPIFILLLLLIACVPLLSQELKENPELDKKVLEFLEEHDGDWHDMNVPASDGQLLHDLIVKNKYKLAVEIGTSTGHSGIWMAWALSKTGGKLITIEIDEDRHAEAVKNFAEAGVTKYIDPRLADAHELVKELEGPIDFVFSDADKGWYTNYFIELAPKLSIGGCFTAHNVRSSMSGIEEFMDYVNSQSNFETKIDANSRSGVSISYKISE